MYITWSNLLFFHIPYNLKQHYKLLTVNNLIKFVGYWQHQIMFMIRRKLQHIYFLESTCYMSYVQHVLFLLELSLLIFISVGNWNTRRNPPIFRMLLTVINTLFFVWGRCCLCLLFCVVFCLLFCVLLCGYYVFLDPSVFPNAYLLQNRSKCKEETLRCTSGLMF